MNELPGGWARATLGDVCDRAGKWEPRRYPDQTFDYIDISAIEGHRVTSAKTLNGGDAPSRARQLVRAGDTILSTVRTYLRNTALITDDFDGATVSTGFCVLRPTATIDARFLFYRVLEDRFVEELSARQTGTSYPAVRDADVFEQPVALPPLAEQRRIVAAIEEHLSRLDGADGALAHTALGLGALRTVIIERTFDPHWPTKPFEEVAAIAGDLVDPSTAPDMPHIAPNHIESGTGRLLPYQTIAADGVTSAKYRFLAGQILYSKIRPYLKKAVLVNFPGLCSADMYPIETHLEPAFLLWWMLSQRFTEAAIAHQGRSVLPKINREALNRLPVPVPSRQEQVTAVESIERNLSLVDSLRAAIGVSTSRSAALRRALLKRAFLGELVPQHPSDEPAHVLLERVAAERAAAPKPTRKRKARATA